MCTDRTPEPESKVPRSSRSEVPRLAIVRGLANLEELKRKR